MRFALHFRRALLFLSGTLILLHTVICHVHDEQGACAEECVSVSENVSPLLSDLLRFDAGNGHLEHFRWSEPSVVNTPLSSSLISLCFTDELLSRPAATSPAWAGVLMDPCDRSPSAESASPRSRRGPPSV